MGTPPARRAGGLGILGVQPQAASDLAQGRVLLKKTQGASPRHHRSPGEGSREGSRNANNLGSRLFPPTQRTLRPAPEARRLASRRSPRRPCAPGFSPKAVTDARRLPGPQLRGSAHLDPAPRHPPLRPTSPRPHAVPARPAWGGGPSALYPGHAVASSAVFLSVAGFGRLLSPVSLVQAWQGRGRVRVPYGSRLCLCPGRVGGMLRPGALQTTSR